MNKDLENIDEPQEEDYTISDERGGSYVVGSVGHGYIASAPSREAAEEAIRYHAGRNWRPSVWVISDHGNAILVEDFDWKD